MSSVNAQQNCLARIEIESLLAIQQSIAYAASSYECQAFSDGKLDTYEMHEAFIEKWSANLQQYFDAREELYKKLYGAEFRKVIEREQQRSMEKELATFEPSEELCRIIKTEISLRTKNWQRFADSIRAEAMSTKYDKQRCKE